MAYRTYFSAYEAQVRFSTKVQPLSTKAGTNITKFCSPLPTFHNHLTSPDNPPACPWLGALRTCPMLPVPKSGLLSRPPGRKRLWGVSPGESFLGPCAPFCPLLACAWLGDWLLHGELLDH